MAEKRSTQDDMKSNLSVNQNFRRRFPAFILDDLYLGFVIPRDQAHPTVTTQIQVAKPADRLTLLRQPADGL